MPAESETCSWCKLWAEFAPDAVGQYHSLCCDALPVPPEPVETD